ncbi:MAG: hypothetical protein A3H42_05850 [Deltaproteobacteria bacterium RIFCSPLOWO2_02_FULL_46_8]|nr:MAG: hypothetical protein A3H42_05850 [Deltaproteobacteria bacterium RIFCSPLOWO2_02_FULL_46_8]
MLRFAVMCNGMELAAWEADCVKKLLVLENIELALIIIDRESTSVASNWSRIKRVGWYGWYLYNLLFIKHQTKAMRPCSIASFGDKAPQLQCSVTQKGKFSQYLSEEDIKTIRNYNLDFILRFGFGIIRGDILNAARFGIWSFHHDDEEEYRGGPPGFWEIYYNDPVTGAILQRLTDRLDGGIILKKGCIRTNLISYVRNRDAIHFVSAVWPVQVCQDILNHRTDYLEAAPSRSTAPVFKAPNNIQMAVFTGKIVWRLVSRVWRAIFFYYQWNIGVVNQPIHMFLAPNKDPAIRWLPPPPLHSFRADPFAIVRGSGLDVLFEEYRYRNSRGFISTMCIADSHISNSNIAIDLGVHTSYPYLIVNDGEIYCIPEMSAKREVCLYRAKEFPSSWVKVATIIDNFAGVDSTVIQYRDRWWLMTMNADRDAISELYIWHAPNLVGPWEPHQLNPVKVDVRSSRPAGTPFTHEGKLYRPVQDCSYSYGQRVVLNHILELTPARFHEETVGAVDSDPRGPYPDGLHTLSGIGNRTLIDGVRKVFVGRSIPVIWYKFKRIKPIVNLLW